ncbi:nuclear transport factor 2 family protein [Lysobacter sp. 5GHs7-4]|uniref:YybH family protein n=1 Tax=Lysobacter sp. 5GHs7-4 TaxID=2904253 RepID=UPI001E619494|nr:nuclear transport factor 2 family protein [Lysobacter sp. 5GHs7-4]UHQ24551.1 nuclear transport factor 2 family protein [Lysobacter sp. 5GHs7-4]
MNQGPAPFLHALQAYRATVRAKDVEAFVALYAQDVHVFDMWGRWTLQGLPAWRAMATEWFASLGDEYVVVDFDGVDGAADGDLAMGHAILTYTGHAADGRPLRSLSNRISAMLRREQGVWKIFHEHTSAPIDHRTTQALLHRDESA